MEASLIYVDSDILNSADTMLTIERLLDNGIILSKR